MDKKRLTLNVTTGMIARVIILVLGMVGNSLIVRKLGSDVNGLYSLFNSILGFLTISELGISSSIAYSLYKPISDGDVEQISALYILLKRVYKIVFMIILVIALSLIPFLNLFSTQVPNNLNIIISYLLFLTSVLTTYFYAHKTTLINSFRDNYISNFSHLIAKTLQGVFQIISIIIFESFYLFLIIVIFTNIIEAFILEVFYRKKYKKHIVNFNKLNPEYRSELISNTKSIFLSNIGNKLINSTDGIIIGIFVNLISLGRFNNYVLIISGMTSVLSMFFSETKSLLGHAYISDTKKVYFNKFKVTYIFNFIIGLTFFLGYYAISSDLIKIIFGETEIIENKIIFVITINYYLIFIKRTTNLFKSSSGLFYQDRYRSLIEGVVNMAISIPLAIFLDEFGVILATIITMLLISYFYEPFILFKYGFNEPVKKFYFIHYGNVFLFMTITFIYIKYLRVEISNSWKSLIVNGTVSVLISFLVIMVLYLVMPTFKKTINSSFNIIKKRRK